MSETREQLMEGARARVEGECKRLGTELGRLSLEPKVRETILRALAVQIRYRMPPEEWTAWADEAGIERIMEKHGETLLLKP